MKRVLYIFLALGILVQPETALPVGEAWPVMLEFDASIGINTSSPRIEISIPLLDQAGAQQYTLACKGGSTAFIDELAKSTGKLWVPDLMCVLNKNKHIADDSLLKEEDVAPWHTRGQFRWSDLLGKCGDYPEFGRLRHFRLRGFELTLSASDLVTNSSELQYFVLKISLRRNQAIKSAYAERPGYLIPEPGCARVRIGKEPRSCRNWGRGGILEPCKE